MEFEQLKRAIEAILFAAGEAVETARLAHALETDGNEIIRAAQALSDLYAYERRGVRIIRLEKAWQMVSSGEMADYVTKALDAITERSAKMLPPPTVNFKGIVGKEPYPVGKKAAQVLRRLVQHGILRLKNLFRGNRSRSEIVATFLAVLELCKTNSVSLEDDVNGDNPNVRLLDTPERKEEPDGI